MIEGLRPYPEMKDSGEPWLGTTPQHWRTSRGKWLFRKMSRPVRDSDEVVTCFRDGTVTLRKNRRLRGFTEALKAGGYQGIRRGDLVIHAMDAFAGAVGVSDSDGKGTPVYSVCEPSRSANSQYYAHVIREMARSQWIQALAKGIRERSTDFRYTDFCVQRLPVPPLAEQAAIVRFLGHVDRRIQRYIRAKQRLIKLLEEQKQAIIHQAVTRGLDPNVRLKPSGVRWLRDVPEHWEVGRLKDVADVQTGLTLGKSYSGVVTETRPYLRVANVQVGRVDLRHVKLVDVPPQEAMSTMLRSGDVLMTEGGDIDKLGRGCVWHGEIPGCLHQNHVFAVRCQIDRLHPEFLVGLMASQVGRSYFQLTAKQTTNLASTNRTTLRAFPIVLPPLAEQQMILAATGKQTSVVDEAVNEAHREIILFQEFRTRLIADVVTGKLDVRDAVARLPDEGDEPDVVDEVIYDVDAVEAPGGELDDVLEGVGA